MTIYALFVYVYGTWELMKVTHSDDIAVMWLGHHKPGIVMALEAA